MQKRDRTSMIAGALLLYVATMVICLLLSTLVPFLLIVGNAMAVGVFAILVAGIVLIVHGARS